MGGDIRTLSGVPVAINFTLQSAGIPDSPLIINTITDIAYYLKAGVVTILAAGSGVTSVAETFTGGLISVAGSPITTSGTLALTVAGTSGGIPYFSAATTWASSGVLTANQIVLGGGAATAPTILGSLGTTTTVLHGNAAGAPTFGAVVEADITLADNTTNDVGTTKHGLAPKAPNDATKYLDGTGAYTVPAGASSAPWPSTTNQIVTANGTVTIPTACTRAYMQMVGSGAGGGGGTLGVGGSGGGAGAYAAQWFTGLTAGNTLTATVPGGGAGGASTVNGTAGSQTKIVSGTQTITTLSANGGNAGLASGAVVAPQTTTAGAALSIPGGGSVSPLAATYSGEGGNGILGIGGVSSVGLGVNGNNYGSGGSGGFGDTGGNGSAGVIIIAWYS